MVARLVSFEATGKRIRMPELPGSHFRSELMKRRALELTGHAVSLSTASLALAHDCRVLDRYLRGAYDGGCDGRTEMSHGKREAKGAATYVGNFVNGKVDARGV